MTWPARYWLLLLVVAGAALRVALFAVYPPLTQPDTGTYYAGARELVGQGEATQTPARRTPGYPAFLLLVGSDPQNVLAAQMALGLLTSVSLFFIALRMCAKPGVAFAAAAAYDLSLQQLFLEATVISEPLTTCLLALMTLALLTTLGRLRDGRGAAALAMGVGLLSVATIMVRPQFIYLALLLPALAVYAASGLRCPTRRAALHALLIAAPILLGMFAWGKLVQAKTGHFAMSTQSGFGLVNHSVEFIELAPPEYANVRDILLRHRAERIAAAGHPGNTIWYAWPEIQQATGWSLPEASRQMHRMSAQMFAEHPLRYAASVALSWVQFWTVPIIWEPRRIEPAILGAALEWVWAVEHKVVRLANLAFVLLSAAVLVLPGVRRAVHWELDATAIAALVFGSSVLQALADRGAGSRYAMTLQALVVLTVVVSAVRWWPQRQAPHTVAARNPNA
jgi:hypothetical protein